MYFYPCYAIGCPSLGIGIWKSWDLEFGDWNLEFFPFQCLFSFRETPIFL